MLRFVSIPPFSSYPKRFPMPVSSRGTNIRTGFVILRTVTLQGLRYLVLYCAIGWGAPLMAAQVSELQAAQSQAPTQPATQKGETSTRVPASTPPDIESMLQAYVGQKVSSIELAGRPDLDERELLPLLVQ